MATRSKPDETSLYYFNIGQNERAYEIMGAHPVRGGCRFTVWAPNAAAVHVAGSFNGFDEAAAPMRRVGSTGVWMLTLPGVKRGDIYKYAITGADGQLYWRSDPYAMRAEERPGTASMVWGIPRYQWGDAGYYEGRKRLEPFKQPMSIYEAHLGSFQKGLSYRELARALVDYVADMGYTHIELMPLCEYPLDMSWGYQVTGYFSATARYGPPEDLMYFVDIAHQRGLGVILDWVPAHYPRDEQGLRLFDGTPLYEHPDPRRSEQTQWGTLLFDFSRTQVHSFLMSNAFYWLREFHFDGLRVDAVSCILYLDYEKNSGAWVPNEHGGNENLDAIAFFKKLSEHVEKRYPHGARLLIAEESTAFPYVTTPAAQGGLGFHYKWNMGWMNDTLAYMREEPIHRRWHHERLTFSLCYAFSEKYILPFSHDEVVHGKRSLLDKMPGDYWQKFSQLRLLLSYQYAHPGKKLNFMGAEFGQFIEWRYDESLDWMLLDYPAHKQMQTFTRALNTFYTGNRPFYERDHDWGGFAWASVDDSANSVIAFIRYDEDGNALVCCFNFLPEPVADYAVPLPYSGTLIEAFSSDEKRFGGTGDWHNQKPTPAGDAPGVKLPPLGAVFFTLTQAQKTLKAGVPDQKVTGAKAAAGQSGAPGNHAAAKAARKRGGAAPALNIPARSTRARP